MGHWNDWAKGTILVGRDRTASRTVSRGMPAIRMDCSTHGCYPLCKRSQIAKLWLFQGGKYNEENEARDRLRSIVVQHYCSRLLLASPRINILVRRTHYTTARYWVWLCWDWPSILLSYSFHTRWALSGVANAFQFWNPFVWCDSCFCTLLA